jgi:hypothetical protein
LRLRVAAAFLAVVDRLVVAVVLCSAMVILY